MPNAHSTRARPFDFSSSPIINSTTTRFQDATSFNLIPYILQKADAFHFPCVKLRRLKHHN